MVATQIVTAALLLREDGQLLLVRHRAGDPEFAGLWSLPMQDVAAEEVAEDALTQLLRERLHVQPGPYEFAETLYLSGSGGGRYVVNVFTCRGWSGEPRFSEHHYEDAAWVQPGSHGSLELASELSDWLSQAFAAATPETDPAALSASLEEARRDLLAAYEAVPPGLLEQPLQEGWSPLDLLAHAASVEAYYAAESLRLLATPGHTWRPFNEGQWEDDHRSRPAEPEAAVRTRLDAGRARTATWLATLSAEQLAAYGNHPERGVVTVGDRINKIARHDREHAAQLHEMQRAAGAGEADAAAD